MLVAALFALAVATTPAAQIETAERAFAADGLTMGIRGSFLKHMADDALVFDPLPANARSVWTAKSSQDEPKLEWWPAWVVASKSGDMGLSTGPAAADGKRFGWYATLWRKDADGTWRWIYDGGGAAEAASAPCPETPAVVGPVATTGKVSPAKAFEAVRLAETSLSEAARRNPPQAYKEVLSSDAHLFGPRGTRTLVPTAAEPRLALRPTAMNLTLRGGGASKAGDLVWTYGEATWSEGQKSVAAHYMHVWQRRTEGWRLIFETLINDR